ncbi:hypothetical protein Y032_0728g1885 [Ancylostoma ceylanicum]|uniref:ABC transporter, ATP-binding protein n=1 Tax=Ancylostoma ceylanicum TaxID=53326 RepID=A0A016WGX1_9BILA|nr:hypothetical protein Y032_0728g1885 [Ancylostoma ceylanicum]
MGLTYLFITLGYSAAPGVVIMIVFLPTNILGSISVKKWQVGQMKLKDERIKMIHEILNGIKVVKLYAWEIPMEQLIDRIRQKQLALLKKSFLVKNLIASFNGASPFLVALFSFATYVLSSPSHQLTPQIAFVSLTLFNQLRSPMVMFAVLIDHSVQAIVSNNRLKNYFVADELDPGVVERDHKNDGEMGKLHGRIGVRGKVAYVPQLPWIQNMTVRDNILFGKPFDKRRYNQVLNACALKPDLKILPNGDMTEIGEKGINLSGGQKARISLARAVYQDCDVYLLDDPLSAVDAHVGKHIFQHRCILLCQVLGSNGILREKTRVLVTHRLCYVKIADEIVVLKDGQVTEKGRYSDLLKQREVKNQNLSGATKGVRRSSTKSSTSSSVTNKHDGKLIGQESVETGKVKMSVYHLYVKAASYWRSSLFLLFLAGFQVFQVLRSFWLSAWSDEHRHHHRNRTSIGVHLGVFCGLGLAESTSFVLSLVTLVFAALSASRNLHAPLLRNLLHSPMSFFDTTPLGRVLNRCAKDIDVVDMLVPMTFRYLAACALQVISTLVVIVISTPIFVVVILPLASLYCSFLRYYVPTSRQLKRLENKYRSPIYSHFSETIQGAASVRAFDKVDEFRNASGSVVDSFMKCRHSTITSYRWLALRLEAIGNLVILFAATFAVVSKELGWVSSPGIIAVSITYALNVTEVLNFAVRQISDIETNIVAVERIAEYTTSPTEAPWENPEEKPPANWPLHGGVKFLNYSTRYREGLDLVLKGFSADVRGGEKIGIVGRTGAGKSSFALALFRMIEPVSGSIYIDDVDITALGLHDLRRNLAIIPQDPILFSGTLRFNLDPFGRNTDSDIWNALDLANLKPWVASFPSGLDHPITEGGENISVGQRQLVCLARAVLRKAKILVLDEATAAIDVTTDAVIQATIREHFAKSTVFTIAHRLNTIMDYDRIMVIENGQIIEFDSPSKLLANPDTAFAKLVRDAESES